MVKNNNSIIRLGLPKGRMEAAVQKLLADASIDVKFGKRAYRPSTSLPGFEVKLQKPQNIIEMLSAGSRDIGFAGCDWVQEKQADLIELLDTGLDPVRIVSAAPLQMSELLRSGQTRSLDSLIVASEFERLTKTWISKRELNATFLKTYGATEVFPPEDADIIVDVTQSGATLDANGLTVIDEILSSSTRLFANPSSLENREKRERIEAFVMIVRSVLEARKRFFVTLNVSNDSLSSLLSILPSMREPTVQSLNKDNGYAISVAVQKESLTNLIPEIKLRGGTDIVVTPIVQLIP